MIPCSWRKGIATLKVTCLITVQQALSGAWGEIRTWNSKDNPKSLCGVGWGANVEKIKVVCLQYILPCFLESKLRKKKFVTMDPLSSQVSFFLTRSWMSLEAMLGDRTRYFSLWSVVHSLCKDCRGGVLAILGVWKIGLLKGILGVAQDE